MLRILYWDIDGTILNYDDRVKPRLRDGRFQALCHGAGFDRLACVSGWSSLAVDPPWHALRQTEQEKRESIRLLVKDAFPDAVDFGERCILHGDNDNRCRHIDFQADWFYVDDWAEEHFVKHHGADAYRAEAGRRVLMCDPYSDGADIVDWLERIAAIPRDAG